MNREKIASLDCPGCGFPVGAPNIFLKCPFCGQESKLSEVAMRGKIAATQGTSPQFSLTSLLIGLGVGIVFGPAIFEKLRKV